MKYIERKDNEEVIRIIKVELNTKEEKLFYRILIGTGLLIIFVGVLLGLMCL